MQNSSVEENWGDGGGYALVKVAERLVRRELVNGALFAGAEESIGCGVAATIANRLEANEPERLQSTARRWPGNSLSTCASP